MFDKSLDVIYNKKYLVIVPTMSMELFDAFKYSFKNVVLMKNNLDDLEFMINFINSNNFKKIVFVDYQVEYSQLIDKLNGTYEFDFIFTKSIGSFSDRFIYDVFMKVYELYNQYESTLGILDKGLFEGLKRHKNVKYIMLDTEGSEEISDKKESNTIGLLNNQEDPKHSFYNELSAIKMLDGMKAKIFNPGKTTKEFLTKFDINYENVKNKDMLLRDNVVNLYINFALNNNILFLNSMDNGIPCILGNSNILDDYDFLKSMLIMNSDDSIDEIADRIKKVISNSKKICSSYKNFRDDYSKKSKKSIEEFLGLKIDSVIKQSDNDLLLTVIVPVYNTEKLLAKSLDSIIESKIPSMEILIINDGSPDNSEKIILDYKKKYPKLIRYIKQENHGLGNVRNVGLKEARGKYIASIDSDDTIHPEFFESALKYLENDIDIVICDWMTITDNAKYETAALDYIFNKIDRYKGLLYTTIMPSTCNKIIKKSLYKNLDLKFVEDKFEDLSANPFIMLEAESIKYINRPYYEYYIRSNSIMRTKPGLSMIDIIKEVNSRLKKYDNLVNVPLDEFKYYTFSWRIEEYVINQLYTIDEEEIEDYLEYVNENLKDIIIEMFNNKYYQERLASLKDDKFKKYIMKRNKALIDGELFQFIIKTRKKKDYYKLTPPIIYYGD